MGDATSEPPADGAPIVWGAAPYVTAYGTLPKPGSPPATKVKGVYCAACGDDCEDGSPQHVVRCAGCGLHHCETCTESCSDCDARLCASCVTEFLARRKSAKRTDVCSSILCDDCVSVCEVCEAPLCNECYVYCEVCDSAFCADGKCREMRFCDCCDVSVCSKCAGKVVDVATLGMPVRALPHLQEIASLEALALQTNCASRDGAVRVAQRTEDLHAAGRTAMCIEGDGVREEARVWVPSESAVMQCADISCEGRSWFCMACQEDHRHEVHGGDEVGFCRDATASAQAASIA